MIILKNLLRHASKTTIYYTLNLIFLALLSLSFVFDCSDKIIPWNSPASLWILVTSVALAATPTKHWRRLLQCLFIFGVILYTANDEKFKKMGFPLTELDLKIFLRDPLSLFDALGITRVQQYWLLAPFVGIVIWFLGKNVHDIIIAGCSRTSIARKLLSSLSFAVLSLAVFAAMQIFFTVFGNNVYQQVHGEYNNPTMHELWSSNEVSKISHKLGILGFFSYVIAIQSHDESHVSFSISQNISPDLLKETSEKYIKILPYQNTLLPNIVFVLGESTFNPNKVFQLKTPFSSILLDANNNGINQLLYVNPVGGGTWVTEFDTITGLDSRLFGFSGFYTHVSLAPSIKKTFIHYLNDKGYLTTAYYPINGSFYGARNAYKKYGFAQFKDGENLQLRGDWSKFSDEKMMDKVIADFPTQSDKPFLGYVLFMENHSPHPCTHFENESQFTVSFAKPTTFGKNCVLNEYLRRMTSTASAISKLLDFLKNLEKTSGRPFVVVFFGDHQPHTFTDSNEFDEFRTPLSNHHTFYTIYSSIPPGNIFYLPYIPKAPLLPTLISAYTAQNYDDLYMPENLFLYDQCRDNELLDDCPAVSYMGDYYRQHIAY